MDSTRKILKENIKKYRNALKRDGIEYCKSADKFSLFIGIEPSTYKKYESTSTEVLPTYENLIKIAEALSVSIDKLFNYEPPDKLECFLKDLDIRYEKDIDSNYILTYPFKSVHVVKIEYNDLEQIFKLWQFLKLKDRTKFDKQFIFMNMAAEVNNPNVVPFDKAENLIKQMGKLKEWRNKSEKEKEVWRKKIREASRKSYEYGFKEFRGGKE